jgi:hypothetical protein
LSRTIATQRCYGDPSQLFKSSDSYTPSACHKHATPRLGNTQNHQPTTGMRCEPPVPLVSSLPVGHTADRGSLYTCSTMNPATLSPRQPCTTSIRHVHGRASFGWYNSVRRGGVRVGCCPPLALSMACLPSHTFVHRFDRFTRRMA